ncbi:prepilin-type N-terminal cleavage/methylation domain-containing protein [Alicyclobacillus macrosporangiidus]|uniref:Prepilin-type N-terminal cleavage/methylation domain-containing protein n=1 Tax=Alicyclobacillus macrosporangiidus TaxID=392015 RepID=A0A1I7JW99_9BACL|nr:prepilin-type N-terminal cleavage/methylation domain-containing protein [Alicyclobacillus macrosporangiidus]SFU89359.1 prepilin-type N-terminal cleavage/methylation domain-containing protein [Alicyclobacillus macrosporangiidus]
MSASHGLTLVELLATIVIASVIMTVVFYLSNFVYRSWRSYTPSANLHTALQFVDQRLETIFQNVTEVESNPSPAQLTCKDTSGNTIDLEVQSGNALAVLNGQPVVGIVVTITPPTGSPQQFVLGRGDVSLAGTTFTVDSNVVHVQLQGTYLAQQPFATYVMSESFAVGGGY